MEITLDLTDGIGRVRMDDGKKNAITAAAASDLAAALPEATGGRLAAYAGNKLARRAQSLELMEHDLAS